MTLMLMLMLMFDMLLVFFFSCFIPIPPYFLFGLTCLNTIPYIDSCRRSLGCIRAWIN